jgi:hypothetical protein
MNPESAVEETSRDERGAILEQRRHGTVQLHRIFPLHHPVVVDLANRTQVPTHEGPLRGCSLLASLRKGRFPFSMPSPTAESGMNLIVFYIYFFHVFFLLTDLPKEPAHPRGKLQGRREGSQDV